MPTFTYQARDVQGKVDTGTIEAQNANEANSLLHGAGKTVMALEAQVSAARGQGTLKKVRSDDIIFFANQLAVMVDTGVPLSEALDAISSSTDHSGLQVIVEDLSTQVKSGVEFSAALERYPKVFSELFTSLIRASEVSGTMGTMLQRVSSYLGEMRETRKQVKGAMVYPVCMLSFCILVVVGLLVFVLPRFEGIYSGKGALLPAPTRALLALSKGMMAYWPMILGGLGATIVGVVVYLKTASGKEMKDRIAISLPVIGPMVRKACLARSLRTMSTMVSSGVAMLQGLEITARVSGNTFYRRVGSNLAERVSEGASLATHLFDTPLIPRTTAQMIDAGERTGKLGVVMDRVAEFCEDDLRTTIKAVTSLIEPVMIIVMGILVGGIAMALLLPIFKMSTMMSGK
ncbi:MAG: type II secretion system F family protein [Planctomycetota bacterium]|jgi:type IV pilus assembly protein PilC